MATSHVPGGADGDARTAETALGESLEQIEIPFTRYETPPIEELPLDDTRAEVTRIVGLTPDISTVLDIATEIPPMEEEATIQHLSELKQKASLPPTERPETWAESEVVIAPLEDKGPSGRRFPRFTQSQIRMFALAVFFILFFCAIGFLLWRQQKKEEERLAASQREELTLQGAARASSAEADKVPGPAPGESPVVVNLDDKTLADSAVQILTAYNPAAASKYRVDVKAGVLTISGEAGSQMEKDGAENVVKPLHGITRVINNLSVKSAAPVIQAAGPNGPVMYPKVNEAEAKRLEEALKRDLAEGTRRAEEERNRVQQQNAALLAQREEEARQESARQRRIQAAAEAVPLTVNPEPARRNEPPKQEDVKPPEPDRSSRTETARTPATELKSGSFTWSGIVKGVEDIVIKGSSSSLNHVSGESASGIRASFSAALPGAPVSVRLVATSGKAPVRIVQQPNSENGYTAVVRAGDGKSDGKPTSFTLRWSYQ